VNLLIVLLYRLYCTFSETCKCVSIRQHTSAYYRTGRTARSARARSLSPSLAGCGKGERGRGETGKEKRSTRCESCLLYTLNEDEICRGVERAE
jgi:hypothetical protein